MDTLLKDIRYGFRTLLKSPGFTLVAVLVLALGIGANSAIFSVVNGVVLRPLPFSDPERIVTAHGHGDEANRSIVVSYPDYIDWRDSTKTFEALAVYNTAGALLMNAGDEPEQMNGFVASADIAQVLNVKPALGRFFTREDDRPDSAPVILLGYDFWRRRFNSDPNIVGKQIRVSNKATTVLGVLAQGFKFPVDEDRTDFVQPVAPSIGENAARRGSHSLKVVGRLKPGVTLEQATAEMRAVEERIEQEQPDDTNALGGVIVPLNEDLVGNLRRSLLVLLAAVGFVLLIACANVANLLLARATESRKEIAIRTALGASRLRILRQLLTESLLLSLAGGGLGLLLAMWGVDLLVAVSPLDIPRLNEVGLDARVFAFTAVVSVLTGLFFGLVPAAQALKVDLNETLKEGGRGSTEGGARTRVRALLVVSEMALSLVLLVGAGLMIRSFLNLRAVNPGFDPHNVMTTRISLTRAKYPDAEQQRVYFHEVLERVKALPGVESAAFVNPLPLSGNSSSVTFTIAGGPTVQPGHEPESNYRRVTPDYFRVMRIPVSKGRAFTEHDTESAPFVVIINESFAKKFFPGEEPLGRSLIIGADAQNPNPPPREIVGVVGDVHHEGLDAEAGPEYYIPFDQSPQRYMSMVVRSKTEGASGVAANVRNAIKELDREQFAPELKPMEELLSGSIAVRRFNMLLLGIFACVALLLAAVGIYGVMAYSVAQRTHEIGIRMALGAQGRDILRMVVGQGMALTFVGVVIGLAASFALTRFISGLLFGVKATDPLTFASVALILMGVALLANLIPARRATRVDPMVALRYE